MPQAAITVVIAVYAFDREGLNSNVTMPQAAITVVIAGPGSVIFTEPIRAFWQTVNMFGMISSKNLIPAKIYQW